MEKETPYWENDSKSNYSAFIKYIGKSCDISFKKKITFPMIDSFPVHYIKAIVLEIKNKYLIVKIPLKKKNYISTLDIDYIAAITMEENE